MKTQTTHSALPTASRRQSGVVLVVALIMLVIISMLAVFSMRAATSSETVANNTRVVALGTQAAEIALRYCEEATVQIASGTVTLASVPAVQDYVTPPKWQDLTNWDSTRTGVFIIPATTVNQASLTSTYSRAPECIVERLPLANADHSTNSTAGYIITVRGFGPEVADGTGRPTGGEIWLQSTIELQSAP